MALRALSIGSAGSAVQLVAISSTSNATPVVATIGANSFLTSGTRLAIAGITGNTQANGIFTLENATATTYRLVGSVGNGTHGGTVRSGIVFDRTPLQKAHRGLLILGGNFVGTLLLESFGSYDEFAAGNNSLLGFLPPPLSGEGTAIVTNTIAVTTSSVTIASSSVVIAAAQEGITFEIDLPFILRASVSAYTSGSLFARIAA